jgi:small-conductance mechanosensitive channel
MNELLNSLVSQAHELWLTLVSQVSVPWFRYQLVILTIAFVFARLFKSRIKKAIETRVRQIKGRPRLLRIIVVTLRRTQAILFVLIIGSIQLVLININLPSQSILLSSILNITLAWILISILSAVIRSRSISRIVAFAGWVYATLVISGFTDRAASFLDSLGFELGDSRITLLLVIKFIVVMTIMLWLAITTGNYLERRIQQADELTPSLRVLFGKMLKIALVMMAVVIATTELGIDLTAFTIFSGALGVGLGFGLQKVVSNFVSGIIILLDRSIKPGDTISLGDTFGWIRELSARFVSVVTRDGREHLIPNENFVTQEVINWSFSNELIRLDVPFGVSYESDPHEVSAMAIEAASSVPRVLSSQKPVCWMTNFGESSLEFVLRFWINDPQNGLTNIRGKVLLALWDVFKLNDIKIPFPHREIVMRNPLQISNVSPLKPEAD